MLQSRYAGLISGVAMCIAGLAIFAFLSPIDFLEPGFVRDGILIQDQYISSNESLESILYLVKEDQDVTVSVMNPISEVKLRLEIKDSEGITINKIDSSKAAKVTYRTESVGKYAVTVTNLGTETTKITVAYGHSISEIEGQEINAILGTSWSLLIIVGSYLILHRSEERRVGKECRL